MDDLVIVGGGPSGLAAANEANKFGARLTVIERLDRVGGLARTVEFNENRFDIGPHRFFTKNNEIENLFHTVVGDDVVRVHRLTRIFYNGKYFNYPLTPASTLLNVGVRESSAALASYGRSRLGRLIAPAPIETFEDWVAANFGRRLYEMFFKTYTEKVWGIPCSRIGADWASQRIKGLSLGAAVANALFPSKTKSIKTLVDEFSYPRMGAGQFYEKMAKGIQARGGVIKTGVAVTRIHWEKNRVVALSLDDGNGVQELPARFFLFSNPLTEIIDMMDPCPPQEILAASKALRYRNHICVNFIARGETFPDNWIYVHSPEVNMARISNYRNFSPAMGESADTNTITVEYFTFPGDGVWEAPDVALIARAKREMVQMKILRPDQIGDAFVVRSEKAYPVIELGSDRRVDVLRQWLRGFTNALPIGRSGMFKYNNQDHAIATGLLAARTALGIGRFDPWMVNIDAEYHESITLETM